LGCKSTANNIAIAAMMDDIVKGVAKVQGLQAYLKFLEEERCTQFVARKRVIDELINWRKYGTKLVLSTRAANLCAKE
jgi:hypothetical protein